MVFPTELAGYLMESIRLIVQIAVKPVLVLLSELPAGLRLDPEIGKRESRMNNSMLLCLVTDNRYGVCPSLLRDQRTILTVVGTARWLVFSLTPQGCLLLESPRAIPVTRGPAMT